MIDPIAPGLYRLDADAYHADPAPEPSLSSTLARLLLGRSPLHAWHASPRLNPDWRPVENAVFDTGRAAHRAVLGAGADYVVIPASYLATNGAASTKLAKDFIAEAREMGLTPIKEEVAEQVEAMARVARGRLAELGLRLQSEESEIAAIARIDDCWCRCLADNAPAGRLGHYGSLLIDFKTTTDASPDAAQRSIMSYGYDLQAAHYLETWKAATGEDRTFLFVFQEKDPPFEVSVVRLDGEALDMARRKARAARQLWAECLAAGQWPGYPVGVIDMPLPEFFTARWLERESRDEDARQRASRAAIDAARRWQSPEPLAGE